MKYMGSKAKYASQILEAIQKECGGLSGMVRYQTWVEPFVGGANMIDKVYGFRRIGNDINVHLIAMFKALQQGWIPPETLSEEQYKDLRKNSDVNASDVDGKMVAFAGIGCSYSGKWFGGYARGNAKNGQPRNYCKESRDNLLKQRENIMDIEFTSHLFEHMKIPPFSIIYCDPPYEGVTKYKDHFDHQRFWEWCNDMVVLGHKVFVSEYSAPAGWKCIWEKQVNSSLTKDTGGKKAIERLFTTDKNALAVQSYKEMGEGMQRTYPLA